MKSVNNVVVTAQKHKLLGGKNMSMKKFLVVAFAMLVGIMYATTGFAAQEYHWKIGHIRPPGTEIDNDVKWFVDKVKEGTNGRIVIDVYPASQLGDYTVVQERVSIGAVEMQIACIGTTVTKALQVNTAPYLATNWEEAKKLYDHNGVVYKETADLLANKENIHVIAGWPSYFGGIALVKSVPAPGDPSVQKKVKIRVPPIKSYELTAQSLGYIATPIPWAETFTAMQTGIVEGAIGAGAEGYYADFRDIIKYYLPVNDHLEMWYLYINKDLWNKLSDEDKNTLTKLGLQMEEKRWQQAPKSQLNNEKRLADYGITVVSFTQDELNAMAKKVRDEVWPVIKKDIGEETFNKVMKEVK